MTHFKTLVFLVVVLVSACQSADTGLKIPERKNERPTPRECAERTLALFRAAAEIEVVRLEYLSLPLKQYPPKETICGQKILGGTKIATKELREQLLRALEKGYEESRVPGFEMILSMEAPHGLRLTTPDGTVFSIAYNFEHHWGVMVLPNGTRCLFITSETPLKLFYKILQDAGLYPPPRPRPASAQGKQ
jgi:hypothetical protein